MGLQLHIPRQNSKFILTLKSWHQILNKIHTTKETFLPAIYHGTDLMLLIFIFFIRIG